MNKFLLLLIAALPLAGCVTTTPPTAVHQPMTARPEPRAAIAPSSGAIFSVASARPLFEDRRARFVGDTLIINIQEKVQASKKSENKTTRSADVDVSVPTIVGLPFKGAQGTTLAASGTNNFNGKGENTSSNDFTGTLTVTVIEVYPNGNLLVSGEKQIGLKEGEEFIRFSGVVNPNTITAANTVTSTQVADARIEYKANGFLDSAQVMGWLGRFFLTFMPFMPTSDPHVQTRTASDDDGAHDTHRKELPGLPLGSCRADGDGYRARRTHQGHRLDRRSAQQPAGRLRHRGRPRRQRRPDHANALHRAEHDQHALRDGRQSAAGPVAAVEERGRRDGHGQPAALRPCRPADRHHCLVDRQRQEPQGRYPDPDADEGRRRADLRHGAGQRGGGGRRGLGRRLQGDRQSSLGGPHRRQAPRSSAKCRCPWGRANSSISN
jgi:flagellar L-ring protein precursor FlgH